MSCWPPAAFSLDSMRHSLADSLTSVSANPGYSKRIFTTGNAKLITARLTDDRTPEIPSLMNCCRFEHAHLPVLPLRLSKRPKHRSSDPNTPQSSGCGSYLLPADRKIWSPAPRTPSRQKSRAFARTARRNWQPEREAANNPRIGRPFLLINSLFRRERRLVRRTRPLRDPAVAARTACSAIDQQLTY
jgi:hypothetical protein